MKIYCIYSTEDCTSIEKPLASFSSISFGISFIASECKKAGHDVRLLVATHHLKSIDSIIECIKTDRPQMLALTSVTSQYPLIKTIAFRAKQIDPEINIILGGHHATLNPEDTILEPCFDAICIGEGENAIVKYIDKISNGNSTCGINNLWIKNRNSGNIDKYPQEVFIQDLDSLPIIDRSLWENYIIDKTRMHSVLVGRGCPNKCTYCSNHVLCKTGTGKYVRFRSPENIIAELTLIIDQYPEVSSIHLEVETLNINLDYIFKLCTALEGFNAKLTRPLSFGTNISITKNIIDNKELLTAFKRANFDFINIGLESGSVRIRNEILKRPKYTNEDFIAFCVSAKKCGLKINAFALIGIPGETLVDYLETVDCIRKCDPQHVFLSIFYPYPGTELYESAKLQGLLTGGLLNPEMERIRARLDLPGFSKKQIQREFIFFPYRAYKGKKTNAVIAATILRTYFSMHPFLNSFYRFVVSHPCLRVLQKRFSPMSK